MRLERSGRWYLASFLVAAGAHAALFTAFPARPLRADLTAGSPPSVEVELLAPSAPEEPASAPAPAAEVPPAPTPPPPAETPIESVPEPTPMPIATPAQPAPTPLAPAPKPKAVSSPKKPTTSARPAKQPTSAASAPTGAVREARPDAPRNRPPHYPEIARRNGWRGRVIVRATVTESGQVASVAIQRSSGFASLDQSALQAVRGWRFLPRTVGGRAVGATIDVPVNFSLRP